VVKKAIRLNKCDVWKKKEKEDGQVRRRIDEQTLLQMFTGIYIKANPSDNVMAVIDRSGGFRPEAFQVEFSN
jgi:hypothetical protein